MRLSQIGVVSLLLLACFLSATHAQQFSPDEREAIVQYWKAPGRFKSETPKGLDGKPIWLCKYYMAKKDWKIVSRDESGRAFNGRSETLPVELAPRKLLPLALKTANLIGQGLYGLDVKQSGNNFYVIEVNDNPSIDHGFEDLVLKDEIYTRVMEVFLRRITAAKEGRSQA